MGPTSIAAPAASSGPVGYTPAQILHAYGFDQIALNGAGQAIAIVDAYDDPSITADLHAFDQRFGLTDPVLTRVNQRGGTQLPAGAQDWATEISLDVEWAHAIAPGARIFLVEADSSSYGDLLTAVDYARSLIGVSVVSMSWYSSEFSGETSYDSHFTTPSGQQGVTFVGVSGDSGTISYPGASPNIVAVGGTSLTIDASGNYVGETGWSGSGGGISAYETSPTYQLGVTTSGYRNNPDVAYDADPNTGFAVYDSYSFGSATPWDQVGGTSAGAPQWAALIAIANQGRAARGLATLDGPSQTLPLLYSLPSSDFHDITTGRNSGFSAGPGYDLVTGLGTPRANLIANDLVNPPGGLEVFAIGSDHAAWTRTQAVPGGPFSPWSSLGGWVSRISVATNADGRLELFGIGSDGAAYHDWQVTPGGGWSGWYDMGGWVSQITVGSNADGRLELFGIGSDGAAYHDWQVTPNGGWSGWYGLGGWVSQITVGSNADGRLELFGIGRDGAAYHDWQVTPNGGWSGWYGLGGWVSQISVATNADGRLDLFGIGLGHALYHQWQVTPGGGWSGWYGLGGWVSAITVGINFIGGQAGYSPQTDGALAPFDGGTHTGLAAGVTSFAAHGTGAIMYSTNRGTLSRYGDVILANPTDPGNDQLLASGMTSFAADGAGAAMDLTADGALHRYFHGKPSTISQNVGSFSEDGTGGMIDRLTDGTRVRYVDPVLADVADPSNYRILGDQSERATK